MTEDEKKIEENAFLWVKENRREIISRYADPVEFEADVLPTTVFMAGSPGAGKTEVSKRLVEVKKAVRIDADEIRILCPGYTGINAHLFQRAASKGVDILYDHILEKKLNAVVDGTFSHGKVIENVERSLKHGRTTEIVFVYQDPIQAWEFTKKREVLERRRITREVFIDAFFESQENAKKVKEKFANKVTLTLIIKDIEHDKREMELNVSNIDPYLKKRYSKSELESLLV